MLLGRKTAGKKAHCICNTRNTRLLSKYIILILAAGKCNLLSYKHPVSISESALIP